MAWLESDINAWISAQIKQQLAMRKDDSPALHFLWGLSVPKARRDALVPHLTRSGHEHHPKIAGREEQNRPRPLHNLLAHFPRVNS